MDIDTKISTMYENIGYLGMYGSDVLITIILIFITFAIVSYISYTSVVSQLKTNWNEHKCNPIIMPFAGFIMPKPGQSFSDTTFENFNFCIYQDLSAILNIIMMPFEFILYLTIEMIDGVLATIVAIIEVLTWLKNQFGSIFSSIYNKIINFLVPTIEIIVHLRDAIGKLSGILTTILYTTINIYNITVSGLINILTILVNLLAALIAVLVSMFLAAFALIPTPAFPAGIAIQIAASAILGGIVLPAIIICSITHNTLEDLFNESSPNAPKKPSIKKHKKKKKK
jgi:hypothetical protein